MPVLILLWYWSVLLFVAIFFLIPIQATFGQGLLRARLQEDAKHDAKTNESAQSDKDSAAVPWNALDERSKKLIREVMDGKTFLRRMPRQVGYCDPEMYDFLTDHPDVVIELWELLGVTNLSLKETGSNKYVLKEGTTSTSQVEVLYKSDNLCIVYALGEYEAPVLRRKIKGDLVLFLKSRYGRDKDNRLVVQSDLDAYVRIHNPGAELLAKILIPVVGKIADSNFEQTVGFVMNISEAAQDDFEPLVELAQRMKNVRPQVAQEFALVAETVFDREVDRYIALATTTAAAMPKYASQSNQDINDRELAVPSQNLRLQAPPTFPPSLDERLIPLTTSEIRRDRPQNQNPATSGLALDAQDLDPSDDVSFDALLRLLQEPVGANARENGSPRDTLAPPPRTLTIVQDGRIVGRGETPAIDRPTTRIPPEKNTPTTPNTPTESKRVVISTMTPSASSVISREPSQQASQARPAVPSPTRFGTTTTVIPQSSGTKSPQK